MSKTINYGIDLGTTNSAIAFYNEGEVTIFKNPSTLKETIASVIAFKGERQIVGEKALELLAKNPNNVFGVFKRKMGTSDKYFLESQGLFLSPVELSAILLKELKNFIHTGDTPRSIVITIPAAFDTVQSNATKQAGYDAGFEEVVLLQEPIAASLAYANSTSVDLNNQKWLVYDLGGGTFDVALAHAANGEMKVVDHEGDNYLGGSDFDSRIIDKFIIPKLMTLGSFSDLEKEMKTTSGKYNKLYNKLKHLAEEAKKELTHKTVAEIEFDITDDSGKEIEVYLELSRDEFDTIIKAQITRTVDMIKSIMTRNDLTRNDLSHILLIGGSTYIPLVRNMLAQELGLEVNTQMDPTTAVVVGAAYYAGLKPAKIKNIPEVSGGEMPQASSQNKIAYERVANDTETVIILMNDDADTSMSYRVIRSDGGYDSGLTKLQNQNLINVPLVSKSNNHFDLGIYKANGDKVETHAIDIVHGNYNIDGQPLPSYICLEVDATDHETTFLEPVFGKNDILPLSKTITKQLSKTILKDSEDALMIKVLEGEVDSLPAANKLIGMIRISGSDLTRDLVRGSDVELTFEISESRDITVGAYLVLTDQEFVNTFSPTEAHIDKKQLLEETDLFKVNLQSKINKYEKDGNYESAGRIMKLIERIDLLQKKIRRLNDDDVSDAKYQIDLEKREIGKEIYTAYNSSYLTSVIEDYYDAKLYASAAINSVNGQPNDQASYDRVIANEQSILQQANAASIKRLTDQLEAIRLKISSRRVPTEQDAENYFLYLRMVEYNKKSEADRFITQGDNALQTKNKGELYSAVNGLHKLWEDQNKDDKNIYKSKGTGLK